MLSAAQYDSRGTSRWLCILHPVLPSLPPRRSSLYLRDTFIMTLIQLAEQRGRWVVGVVGGWGWGVYQNKLIFQQIKPNRKQRVMGHAEVMPTSHLVTFCWRNRGMNRVFRRQPERKLEKVKNHKIGKSMDEKLHTWCRASASSSLLY